jgi:uncharacterized membrane protein YfcA
MIELLMVLTLGLVAGVLSGFFGVGGGVLIVPTLVVLLAMPMHAAIGTSLAALLPPVGILGAYQYYKTGNVNVGFAAMLAIGLILGGFVGGKIAIGVAPALLRRAFAIFMIAVSIRMLLK